MNRLIELNREDMYVRVEAGMSWKALHEALEGTGLTTPYWGTLSGLHATVGGGMSQNSIFWGSGRHGSAANSVIGLEVVLASGEVTRVGRRTVKGVSGYDLCSLLVGSEVFWDEGEGDARVRADVGVGEAKVYLEQ